jgi:hypothetical protein
MWIGGELRPELPLMAFGPNRAGPQMASAPGLAAASR